MRTQHVQILNVQWPTTTGDEIVYLAVIVKE